MLELTLAVIILILACLFSFYAGVFYGSKMGATKIVEMLDKKPNRSLNDFNPRDVV